MDVESQLRRLVDRRAIEELRYEYCYRIDHRDWEGLVGLFTRDATLDYGGLGTYEGRDGVRTFAEEFVAEELAATAHAVHNPVIDVDGDEATGRWYVTSPLTYADGTAGFRMGQYDERYRRVDGEWLIADLRMRFRYAADFDPETGWPDLRTFTPE